MRQGIAIDRRRGVIRRRVLDDLALQLRCRTGRDEHVAVDHDSVEDLLAQATLATGGEEVALNVTHAPGGRVGHVPLRLHAGDGLKGVVKPDPAKQFATLVVCHWVQPKEAAYDQLRL